MGIIFLGAPGSGKGTIASRVCEDSNLDHLSTGDVFRELSRVDTDLGKQLQKTLARGELVADALVMSAVAQYIKAQQQDKTIHGFVFDGIPRTLEQAKQLDKIIKIERVFLFVISDEQVIDRLTNRIMCKSCSRTYNVVSNPPKIAMTCDDCKADLVKRSDDVVEVAKQRLQTYKEYSKKIIEYYDDQDKLEELDATMQVTALVAKLLGDSKLFSR